MTEVFLPDLDATHAWAREFAKTLHAPVTVALHGDLGMGKSEIARTIIRTLRGENTVVPSPTFTLVQNYDGISHFDLYRITDASELEEIGWQTRYNLSENKFDFSKHNIFTARALGRPSLRSGKSFFSFPFFVCAIRSAFSPAFLQKKKKNGKKKQNATKSS